MITYKVYERIKTINESETQQSTTTSQTLATKIFGLTLYKKVMDSVIDIIDSEKEEVGFKKPYK